MQKDKRNSAPLLRLLGKDQTGFKVSRELILSENRDLRVACGALTGPRDVQYFVCRLLSFSGTPDQRRVQHVDVHKGSFDLLAFYGKKILELLELKDKALIFQNTDVQVYLMEENESEGFMVHVQDMRRVKVSLSPDRFRTLMGYKERIYSEYENFKMAKSSKKRKMRAASKLRIKRKRL